MKKIHFIGIGGIGVSALAQYYLKRGHKVSGSDLIASEITDFLKKKGVTIMIGNNTEHIQKDFDLVIYSPAVKHNNLELLQAKSYNIKAISYPEALGELTKEYYTIAVSGSHGKSTTTAMVSLILIKAGIDPTVIVGTKLKEFNNSNFRMGKSKYLVIEACEYDGSFLNYQPNIVVITNVDKEHMDYFKTFSNVKKTFKDFIKKLPPNGYLVFNSDDPNARALNSLSARPSTKSKFGALVPVVKNSVGYSLRQKEAKKMILGIPGKHNVSNALAALSVARILKVPDSISFESLKQYQGSWRRFEIKQGKTNGKKITIISDYGHHPNEVLATLTAAREKYPKKKLWLIFQPHQYQRTYYLFKDFIKVFRKVNIDQIIITDIYDVAGRETKAINTKVNSELLVKKIARNNIQYMNMNQVETYVKEHIKSGEVLIIMGAGNIYKLADKF